MHLGNAIVAHEEWVVTFRQAIASAEIFDVVSISADDACDLGRWLHGEGKRLFGNLPIYTRCVATHTLFHREAAKVATAINGKHLVDAECMLAAHTPFSEASRALADAIVQLQQDAASASGFISLIAKLSRS